MQKILIRFSPPVLGTLAALDQAGHGRTSPGFGNRRSYSIVKVQNMTKPACGCKWVQLSCVLSFTFTCRFLFKPTIFVSYL